MTSWIAFALTLLALARARAHIPLYGVGTACRLVFKEDRVLLTFDLSYDSIWAQAEMIAADKDKSSSVEEGEAEAYRKKQWDEKISPRVKIRFDGKEIPFVEVAARHEGLVGEIYGVPFSLYYELEATFPGGKVAEGSVHTLEIEDTVVRDETPARPQFIVPYRGHGLTEGVRFNPQFEGEQSLELDSYLIYGSPFRVKFSFDAVPGVPAAAGLPGERDIPAPGAPSRSAPQPSDPESTTPGSPSPEQPAPAPAGPGAVTESPPRADPAAAEAELERAVREFDRLPWYTVLGFILLAVAYGAGHALAPGHGKAMVAAYLIGSRGRVRDAVILGLATTITHTGSVFLFGLAIFLIVNAGARHSEGALHNMVIVGTQLISGLLLLLLGLVLFVRRWRGLEEHGHHHHDGHDHQHGAHHHAHEHGHAHPHGHVHDPLPAGSSTGGEHPAHEHHHDHHDHPHHHHHDHHHHDHGDHHHHHHGHHHHHHPPASFLQGGAPRLRDLITLGFSGGLVPCPAGLTVILIGLHYPGRLLFVLALLVFFSIGLGAVLTGIGISLVAGKAILATRARKGTFFQEISFLRAVFPLPFLAWLDRTGARLFKLLPALSALFIAALGAFFCASTYATGKTQLAAMLRQLAEWIQ